MLPHKGGQGGGQRAGTDGAAIHPQQQEIVGGAGEALLAALGAQGAQELQQLAQGGDGLPAVLGGFSTTRAPAAVRTQRTESWPD